MLSADLPERPVIGGGWWWWWRGLDNELHTKPAQDRVTADAIYYYTDSYLHSLCVLSFSSSSVQLYINHITLRIIKMSDKENTSKKKKANMI